MAKQDNPLLIAAVSALWLLAVVLFTSGLPAAKAQSYETRRKERLATVDQVTSQGDFRPDWASLGRYRVPEWYRDAKFGIFIHWGVFSVPAFANEWFDFPENAAVLDVERGKLDGLRRLLWQSDTSVSVKSWGYVEHDTYRTPKSLIAELVDVVSKNGNFLLNVGPKSDGTIPDEAREVLLAMGQWLSVNGEAIFGSRPWMVYGEGPTSDAASHTMGNDAQSYSAQDIRFTTKGDMLYAIALGWPEDGKLTIHTLWEGTPLSACDHANRTVRLHGEAALATIERRTYDQPPSYEAQ